MKQTQIRRSLRLHDSFQKNVLTQKSDNTKPEMGSKTPSNKAKQQLNACDLCDSKFCTGQALRSHKKVQHSDELVKSETPEPRPKATPKNNAVTSRASKRLRLKKGKNSDESGSEDVEEKKSKINFSCPICNKIFTIYFRALKHIQKSHCVDSEGNPVSPDSPDIIKPLTTDDNEPCDNTVCLSPDTKETEISPDQYNNVLFCLACDQRFKSVVMFNRHASLMHRDDVDSMFFKTLEEFSMWKQMMETQVKVKYLSLKQQTSQKYYHCNYVSPNNEFDKTYLCPSIIEVKESHAGVQIHYSKEHFGHTSPKYQLPEEFLQYLTSKKDAKLDTDPFDDMYAKLRDLLEIISDEAGKASISHLEQLYNSALKMKSLLRGEKDKDALMVNRSMTDDQITDALEGKRSSARLKRKSETVPVDAKKKKDDKSDDDSKSKNTKENKFEPIKGSSPALLSPTFNDTYKQFIGSPTSEPKTKNTKRKEVVKTKMGQYSPKKKESLETVEKIKTNILKPSKTNTVIGKILKYEVKEQENDCNILILKI